MEIQNIFGEPGTGVHSYRVFNLAIVDIVLTVLLAYGLSQYFMWNFLVVLLFLFILGIIMHRLFGVKTTIDKLLFI
jgi:hypothetical protein